MQDGKCIAFRLRKNDDDINLLFHLTKPTVVARTVINAMLKNKSIMLPLPIIDYEPPRLNRRNFHFNYKDDKEIITWLQNINGNYSSEIRRLIKNAIQLSQTNVQTHHNDVSSLEYKNYSIIEKSEHLQDSTSQVLLNDTVTESTAESGILDEF